MSAQHAQAPTNEFPFEFPPVAATIADLEVGDLVAFDPLYGRECVVGFQIQDFTLPNGVNVRHMQLGHMNFHGAFGARDEDHSLFFRYVVRGAHEPCMRWKRKREPSLG